MIYSEFDDQDQILKTRFEGDVTLSEIINYINSVRLNDKYPRELKIITDTKDSIISVSKDEIIEIVKANKESLKVYDFIIDSIILERSQNVKISLYYQELSRSDNYFFKIFANYEKANNWLLEFKP